MGFRRLIVSLVGQTLLFGCGAAAVAAWMGGLYASLVLALLLALWLATVSLLRVLPRPAAIAPSWNPSGAELAVMRSVLDQAPTPLLAIEDGPRVRALNRAARRLFAVDGLLPSFPEALLVEERFRHGNRSYRIDRIEAHGAGAARTILSLVDIESEERIAEARATRELLQVLSHEVMNALTPIASLSESALAMLDDRPTPLERLHDVVGTLSRRAAGLLHFTHAYRELARLPEPVPASVPLAEIFADLQRMFEARWSGAVVLELRHPAGATIRADRDQLVQALWALLQNGGEATFDSRRARQVQVEACITAESVALRVMDTGPGIPADVRDRIFRPFFTTKPQGSGVGLTLVRQIARAHGGELTIEDVDLGSSFVLSLPLPQAAA